MDRRGQWQNELKRRIWGIFVLMVVFFAAVILKQIWIQVVDSGRHKTEGLDFQKGALSAIGKNGVRGSIFDRNGNVLAVSEPRSSINAHPNRIKDAAKTAKVLAPLINMNEAELTKKLSSDAGWVPLVYKAPDKMCKAVFDLQWNIHQNSEDEDLKNDTEYGIEVFPEATGERFYPKGRLASHILGFVGKDERGLEGIEAEYNGLLAAKPAVEVNKEKYEFTVKGKRKAGWLIDGPDFNSTRFDVLGNLVPGMDGSSAADDSAANPSGCDVVLTIDERVQFIVEDSLAKTVKFYHAKEGSCIVMDAKTAEILAMANYPDFEPANFSKSSVSARKNTAIYDFYEPGSIFKVFTSCVALKNGVSKNSMFACPYVIYADGYPIKNATGDCPRPVETVAEIVAQSYNTGTANMVFDMGARKFYEGLRDIGFGSVTGIELSGETEGILDDWKNWSKSQLANISFGQGVCVTPLQLSSAFQAVANDGTRLKPHIVKELRSADGKVIKRAGNQVLGRPFTPAVAADIRDMMAGVVSVGTGSLAGVPGYKVGGKTGTAQMVVNGAYSNSDYIAGFAGIAPIDNPRIIVLVKIVRPQGMTSGGYVAAPMFGNVCSRVLPLLGVTPTPGYVQVTPHFSPPSPFSKKTNQQAGQ